MTQVYTKDQYNKAKLVREYVMDYGLTDVEIAEKLGVSRRTILRIRKEHNIPKYNKNDRVDKQRMCSACKEIYFVRRKPRPNDTVELVCTKCKEDAKKRGLV